MTELHVAPEQHFEALDYSGSELLIFKYDAERKRLLVCFDDLSEKIPEWVSGKKRVSYSFRYKILHFCSVSDFQRSEIDAGKFLDSKNDFYIVRDTLAVLIDDIEVQPQSEGQRVCFSFERGFGVATFCCKEIKAYELPFYFKKRHAGKNYYYDYVDSETKKDYDEEEFLRDLYEVHA